MKAALALEYIGEGHDAKARLFSAIAGQACPEWSGLLRAPSRRPWVAEINGNTRSFLRANWQRKRANSTHTRGVELWFVLESGRLYEVCAYLSWRSKDRYFCTVNAAGDIRRLSAEEARQWQNAD